MADFGALSSLGLGSNVLNYDVIEKLRQADEARMLAPIDRRLESVEGKKSELTTITTLTSTLKSTVLDLADGVIFAKRSVQVSGETVSAEVKDGVAPQDLAITVNTLAKRDIWQSRGFTDEASAVVDRDTTMTLSLNGIDYSLDVSAGTTLSQLRDMLNEKGAGNFQASILNVGGSTPYTLVLKSTETGADQAISVTYDDGDTNTGDDDFLSLSHVQTATDADFTYNGIEITRASNTVEDLVPGLTLHLLKEDATATTNISIKQDIEGIADTVAEFIDAYNAWYSEMTNATKYDPETHTAGIFQGDNTINSLKYEVARALNAVTEDGKGLASFGMDITKDGIVTFDRTAFVEALKNDPESVEKTLVGSDASPGVFKTINQTLATATDSDHGSLALLDTQLSDRMTRLEKERERTLAYLDARYNTMAQRFAAYDEMIASFNASFQSLQQMIDAQVAAAKK
ncbi:flagellar filament capping protein FliD [Hydrogenimonas sp.]